MKETLIEIKDLCVKAEEKEKQNYTDEEINKILEIGLSIMDK